MPTRASNTISEPGPDHYVAAAVDHTMVKALARAFRRRKMLDEGVYATIQDLAKGKGVAVSYVSRVLRLTLMAPEIVEAILDGRQPPSQRLDDLSVLPDPWAPDIPMTIGLSAADVLPAAFSSHHSATSVVNSPRVVPSVLRDPTLSGAAANASAAQTTSRMTLGRTTTLFAVREMLCRRSTKGFSFPAHRTLAAIATGECAQHVVAWKRARLRVN